MGRNQSKDRKQPPHIPQSKVSTLKGVQIGRKTIVKAWKEGPRGAFTYCRTRCECGSVQERVALGVLGAGRSVSCKRCLANDIRIAVAAAKAIVYAERRKEAEDIRKQWQRVGHGY